MHINEKPKVLIQQEGVPNLTKAPPKNRNNRNEVTFVNIYIYIYA
jgi:hypothetical protein